MLGCFPVSVRSRALARLYSSARTNGPHPPSHFVKNL